MGSQLNTMNMKGMPFIFIVIHMSLLDIVFEDCKLVCVEHLEQSYFLANDVNKKNFINFVTCQLNSKGIMVVIANDDANTVIVQPFVTLTNAAT